MEASLPTASAGAAAPDGRATAGDDPLIFIVSGPGGVGKGTIVKVLVERDPVLWLSRSWTTREQRPGEADDAYVFTSRDAFEHRIGIGGFLEWTDFLGNYYGTPMPEPTPGRDTVLEIEVDGARQVKSLHPDAVLIFVLPPSRDEQARRLRGRGDPDHKVDQRVRKAEEEEPIGRALADHIVVNDDLARTVDEMLSIIQHHRSRRGSGPAIR
jgi:guanylate kinase